MNRWAVLGGVFIAVFWVVLYSAQSTTAQDGGDRDRVKVVEINTTQYIWELVSRTDGQILCQAILDRPTQPTLQETIDICGDVIFPVEPTPTPLIQPTATATPPPGATPVPGAVDEDVFDLNEFFQNVYWRFVSSRDLVRTVEVPLPEMVLNLNAPSGPVENLFVTITAYEPLVGEQITGVYGILNGWEFTCAPPRCDVPISGDSALEFWATSSFGDESDHVYATLRQIPSEQGKRLEITSITPVVSFVDSCSSIWGTPLYDVPSWARFPTSPDDLATMKPYQYLAGRLIFSGVVDASDCPGGGLTTDGAPNACGLEKAGPAVIEWQNQFDVTIWDAGRDLGVPPVVLKTLIGQETQFWPGNGRNTLLFEYGLGQLSQSGADVALRWDNDLYQTICSGVILDCSVMYGRLSPWLQATMRGAMMRAVNTECATCPNGVDIVKTHETIPILGRTLRANCRQAKYMIDRRQMKAGYEDLWKLTFVSYHSGYQCLANALNYAAFNREQADWASVSKYLTCYNGTAYVNDMWTALNEFDGYRIKRPESSSPVALPTFVPTAAPTLTPTPVRAMSHLRVVVYQDANNNNYPENEEKIDGVMVDVQLSDGATLSGVTVNGEVIIRLDGQAVGAEAVVTLPDLYRTQRVLVLRDGEIPVIFRLEPPVVPPALP